MCLSSSLNFFVLFSSVSCCVCCCSTSTSNNYFLFLLQLGDNFSILSSSLLHMIEGTYKQVPKVPWTELLVNHFGNPDWVTLYPLVEGSVKEDAEGQLWGTPKSLLPPRTACKLFHDGVYILDKCEENVKFMQDRIPEACHKQFKKKQWRKQFFEACRRVCCRLAIGLGFKPNCVAEDVFIHAILNMSFELGWNRIKEFTAGVPMTERDRGRWCLCY